MDLLWKTALMYIIILVIMRVMGKREIGQLSLFDFVVLLLIADVGALAIDKENDYFIFLIPILVLVVFQKAFAIISLKFKSVRTLFDGKETIIIYDGKLNIKEMKKQFYNIDDLLTQVRLKNVNSLKDIKYLFLETNGEISIFLKSTNHLRIPSSYVKSKSLNITGSTSESTILDYPKNDLSVFPVITSGKINDNYLELLNLDKEWVLKEVKRQGYTEKSVYYACLDEDSLFIMPTIKIECK